MKKILSSKKLLISFTLMIFSLSVLKVCLDSVTEQLTAASNDLARKSSKSSIRRINEKMDKLESVMAKVQPPYMTKSEASRFLTETAEDIRVMYNGKYTSTVKEESSSLLIDLEFTIAPEDPRDVTRIADYFENSISPIIYINRMQFAKLLDKRTVTFRITLKQPYYGGAYEY